MGLLKRNRSRLRLSVMLTLFIAVKANAGRYYVNDNSSINDIYTQATGSNANPGNAALPFATVTYAYSVAAANDTIYIDAGAYDEAFINVTKAGIKFIGAGYTSTVFDHNFAGTATDYFMYINASDVTLQNVQLRGYENNGTQTPGHSGQAITIGGGASVISGILIKDVLCLGNGMSGGNPAISVLAKSTVTITGGGNFCNTAGTMYTGGIEAYGQNINLTVTDHILGNNYKVGAYDGGGLRIEGDATTIVSVRNTLIKDNIASDGGGISITDGVLNIYDCVFDANSAGQTSSTVYGGALRINAGTVTITRSIFKNNFQANGTLRGGAIAARYITTGGGGFSTNRTITATIDSSVFENNSPGTLGMDIYAANGFGYACTITARDCQFLTSGNYNLYSDASSPASGINVTYFGTAPTSSGSNVTATPSSTTLYTPTPNVPVYTGSCPDIFIGTCTNPTITSAAPSTSICTNTLFSTSLTAIPLTQTNNYSWTSTAVAGITGHSTSGTGNISETLINTTAGDLVVSYVVTPYSGTCTGTPVTYDVTVKPLPIVTATAASYALCNSVATALTASGTAGNAYSWSPAAGLNVTNGASVDATISSNTIYTVTATGTNSCVQTDTVTLTVKSLPAVTANASVYAICSGSSTNLSATGTGGNSYIWTPDTALSSNTGSPVIATITSGIIYTVTATGTNGCINTDTVTLTAKPLPAVSATSSDYELCAGSSTILSANGADTYTWLPNTDLNINTGPSVTSTPLSTFIYTVTGSATNGCQNTDTVGIIVHANDNPSFTYTPFTQCLTGADPIPAIVIPGGTFTGSGSLVIDAGSGLVDLDASGTGNYTITYSTPITNACPNDTTLNFQITNGSIASFSYVPDSVCNSGSTIQIVPSPGVSPPFGYGLFTSNPSDGLIFSNAATGEISAALSTPGTYVITNTIAASGTCLAQQDSTTITILKLPASTYTGLPASLEVCDSSSVINLTPINPSGVFSGNSGISGSTFDPSLAGVGVHTLIYSVDTLIGTLQCNSSSSFNITVNPLPDASFTGLTSPVCEGSLSQGLSANIGGGAFSGTGVSGNNFDPTVSGPGTFYVTYTLTDAKGCIQSSSQPVLVNVLPDVPVIISGSGNSICEGDSTLLTVNTSETIFNWIPGGSTNDSLYVNASGDYTVYVTSADGCTSASAVTTITVNSLPAPTTLITNGPSTVCFGDSVLLIATGADATNYTWSPTGADNDSVYVSVTGSVLYSVSISDVNNCKNSTASNSIYVTVNPLPATPVLIAPNGSTVCFGDSVLLVASGTTAANYSWTPSGFDNDSIFVSAIGSAIYNVSVSDVNGCTSSGASNSITVTVNALPLTPALSVSGLTTVCFGDSILLVATSNGASNFTWSPAGADNDSIYVSAIGTTDYYVSVSNSFNCAASDTSNHTSVTVNPLPDIPTLLAPNGATVCFGDSILLTVSGTGATEYTWSPSGVNNDSVYVSAIGSTNYYVSVSNSFNCTASDTSNHVLATVNPLPENPVVSISGVTANCLGDSVLLTAVAAGATNYTWSPSGTNNSSIYVHNSGNYSVSVSDANQCAALLTSNSVAVAISTVPHTKVNAGNDVSVCKGASVSLSASNAGSYLWSGPSTATINPAGQASTTVIVTSNSSLIVSDPANVCSEPDTVAITITTIDKPVITASPQTAETPVDVSFAVQPSNYTTYSWNFGDTTQSHLANPVHNYVHAGTIFVTLFVTSAESCPDSASLYLDLKPKFNVIIPNIFSPNADGKNDIFTINITGGVLVHTNIYNRWGTILFDFEGSNTFWDGRTPSGQEASDGIYYYIITVQKLNGEIVFYKGALTLVR